jgi:hypothetical protein
MCTLFNDAVHQIQQLHGTELDVDAAGNDNSRRLCNTVICVRVAMRSELLKEQTPGALTNEY